jgi:hypothetical protein
MKVSKFYYNQTDGWADPLPKQMDSAKTLILLFGASDLIDNSQPIRELCSQFPESKIIGCSTAGEIFGDTCQDENLVGAIVQFQKTTIKTASASVKVTKDSWQAGVEIAKELQTNDLQGVLVFSDGLNVNGSELVAGINAVLPSWVKVTGGLAGDKNRFCQTWVLVNRKPQSKFVTAVGLYGEKIKIQHGTKGGWDIFGPERKITKSKSNQLFELDGKPALQLYKTYLGERAAELPASALLFPLALRRDKTEEKRIVRTILGVNEKNQSMTFAGDLPEGSMVQLMRTNLDRLIDGASEAGLMARPKTPIDSDLLSIAISCVGRRLILGERAEEELEAAMDSMPAGTTQIGFYSYGEICPFETGYCDLHNQSIALTTIYED